MRKKLLLALLATVPWMTILRIIFKWFVRRYGNGVTGFALDLIGLREIEKKTNKISSTDALLRNIKVLKVTTTQSPGLSTTECILLNLAAYAEWTYTYNKRKKEHWESIEPIWVQKGKNRTAESFMDLYFNRLDLR